MSELPSNWVVSPIGDLISLNPKIECPAELPAGFVPMQMLGKEYSSPVRFESRPWGEIKKGYTHFANGDVLLAKITPCFENGKAGLVCGLPNGVGAGSTEYFVSRPHLDVLNSRYLYAFLKTEEFLKAGAVQMTGSVGHKRVPKDYLLETELPLAPLNEQKRIADKLDAVLARVDACRDRLDRIPAILKRFRQSVLAAATSGKLTTDWRSGNPIENTWSRKNLGDYVENCDGKRVPISEVLRAARHGEYPYYGASGIIDTIDGYTHDGKFLLIGEDGANLLTRSKPIAFIATGKIWVNNHAHVLQCRDGAPEEFLGYFINSIDLAPYVSGSAQPKLNQKNMNSIIVPVPPVEEQTEIVRRVEALFACADRLEARHTAARAQVEKLTPATLAKAFRGELVPQDPSDEPASVLLERIKATTSSREKQINRPKRASAMKSGQ